MKYKFTVIDMFAVIGGSGGCCLEQSKWDVRLTFKGLYLNNSGLIFYIPGYFPIYDFITKN